MLTLDPKISLTRAKKGINVLEFILLWTQTYIAFLVIEVSFFNLINAAGDPKTTLLDVMALLMLNEVDNIIGEAFLALYVKHTPDGEHIISE